ncbi:hypothetical protein IT402_00940 [Candidatus Nomurabacteria bacterium]|nr:hypothetical protein [Candidatus Nomurabacteria bacterium]
MTTYVPNILGTVLMNLVQKKNKNKIKNWITIALFLKGKPDSKSSKLVRSFIVSYRKDIPIPILRIFEESLLPDVQEEHLVIGQLFKRPV